MPSTPCIHQNALVVYGSKLKFPLLRIANEGFPQGFDVHYRWLALSLLPHFLSFAHRSYSGVWRPQDAVSSSGGFAVPSNFVFHLSSLPLGGGARFWIRALIVRDGFGLFVLITGGTLAPPKSDIWPGSFGRAAGRIRQLVAFAAMDEAIPKVFPVLLLEAVERIGSTDFGTDGRHCAESRCASTWWMPGTARRPPRAWSSRGDELRCGLRRRTWNRLRASRSSPA